jgi:signal transduction histidine kinase
VSRRSAPFSLLGGCWPELLWGLFAALNVVAIVRVPNGQTVPFHFIWVSFAIVYGIRRWPRPPTLIVLAVVCAVTAAALFWAVTNTDKDYDELTEVPLMAVVFLVLMFHVEQRQAQADRAHRLAEDEHSLLERQRDMVRNASHELRTPITVARGHAELIRSANAGQLAEKDAEVILDELDRLSRIAERLLILAAAEYPGFLRRAPVDVEVFLTHAARRWSPTAQRRWEINVAVEGTLLADEERLESTLDALIENAVKFTNDGDTIAIAGRAEGEVAVIEISDTGLGIRVEHLTTIFERFSSVKRRDGQRTNGTGLGLAIVKAVVEAHVGRPLTGHTPAYRRHRTSPFASGAAPSAVRLGRVMLPRQPEGPGTGESWPGPFRVHARNAVCGRYSGS